MTVLELERELEIIADPDASVGDLLATEFRSVRAYEVLAARTNVGPEIDVHLAVRVSGSSMSFNSGEKSPGSRCMNAFYSQRRTPLSIEVAAQSLVSCSESGKNMLEVARVLTAHPDCSERARVLAVWSILSGRSYSEIHPASVENALLELGKDTPVAQIAVVLMRHYVQTLGRKGRDVRTVVRPAPFARKAFEILGELSGAGAVENYAKLSSEWLGSHEELIASSNLLS